jgi:hypothetical protein
MKRPASVTVIAALFFLIAGYLVATGIIELVVPGILPRTLGAPVTYGRELTGPRASLSVGTGWAFVGWGLYRLQNWARWCAILLMVLGVAGWVPAVSAAARDLGWGFFWFGAQVMVRIVIAWFLAASPELIEAFAQK